MAVPLIAQMPDDVEAGGDWIMRWRAIDPTTGADVTGVVVSNVNVDGDVQGGELLLGPWALVPGPNA